MNEELYNRQEPLNLKQVKSAIVVGLGGTGSWVAFYLADSGCPELHLMDGDKLEVVNFNRLYIPIQGNLGRQKTEAIGEYLKLLRPDCSIQTYGKATQFSLLEVAGGDTIFDCTDSEAVQQMLYKWAKDNNRRYIRSGYDGTHITVVDRVPSWSVGEKATGYEIRPSWVVPASISAAFAVSKAMYCPDTDIRADLNEFVKAKHIPIEDMAKTQPVTVEIDFEGAENVKETQRI